MHSGVEEWYLPTTGAEKTDSYSFRRALSSMACGDGSRVSSKRCAEEVSELGSFTSTRKQDLQRGRGVIKSFNAFLAEISVGAVEHESWEVGREVLRDLPKINAGWPKNGFLSTIVNDGLFILGPSVTEDDIDTFAQRHACHSNFARIIM
jgi:hypothetical protein